MTKIFLKNMPRLRLADVLRRRKMGLRQLLDQFGITTYSGLVIRCERMGVMPPTESEFKAAYPAPPVNSPQEGIIVLEAPPVLDEISGREIDPQAPVKVPEVKVITEPAEREMLGDPVDAGPAEEPTAPPKKRPRRKKAATQGE